MSKFKSSLMKIIKDFKDFLRAIHVLHTWSNWYEYGQYEARHCIICGKNDGLRGDFENDK